MFMQRDRSVDWNLCFHNLAKHCDAFREPKHGWIRLGRLTVYLSLSNSLSLLQKFFISSVHKTRVTPFCHMCICTESLLSEWLLMRCFWHLLLCLNRNCITLIDLLPDSAGLRLFHSFDVQWKCWLRKVLEKNKHTDTHTCRFAPLATGRGERMYPLISQPNLLRLFNDGHCALTFSPEY